MNNDLLAFVKHLSNLDPKTLTQKALKTTEEVGELAKSVLPYENASGTLHRFVTKPQILDNAADIILCAYSIAYNLGYDDSEIEAMLLKKATKWSGLLSKESKGQFPLPFELHVSVADVDYNKVDLFKSDCGIVGVKPIIIELEKGNEMVMRDCMTSSIIIGDNNTAMDELIRIGHALKTKGYKVVRQKIETVPWHPAAPSISDSLDTVVNEFNYFESHLRIVTTADKRPTLQIIAKESGAHLSRNYFKMLSETEFIIMMTLREYKTCAEAFQERVQSLHDKLERMGFIVDKVEIEFALYDSNMDHDKAWLS
jgi:hypothetical protein